MSDSIHHGAPRDRPQDGLVRLGAMTEDTERTESGQRKGVRPPLSSLVVLRELRVLRDSVVNLALQRVH